MKLSGWYRIGIVLSFLWCLLIIGITVYQFKNSNIGDNTIFVSTVSDLLSNTPNQVLVTNNKEILFFITVPVIAGWILVFAIIWTVKWIIRGFKEDKKS